MSMLIDVVVPVFAIVGLGYFAGIFRVLGPESATALNRFVYYFALPPVLFIYPARQPIDQVLHWPFISAFIAGAAITLAVAWLANRLWLHHNSSTFSLHALVLVYPNTSYMGVPLFLTAFGTEGAMPAIIATVVGITLFVGSTIAVLEAARAKGPSAIKIAREVVGTLACNPLLDLSRFCSGLFRAILSMKETRNGTNLALFHGFQQG
jgi:predicted permease